MNVHDAMEWIRSLDRSNFSSNLVGVGWGQKTVRGQETDEYSLIFRVAEKKPLQDLLPNEVIPTTINIKEVEYITDVQQCPLDEALVNDCHSISDTIPPVSTSRKRTRPLMGGTESETSWGIYVATLGIFVTDKSDGQVVALSNNHVFAASQVHAFYNATNSDGFKSVEPLSSFQPTGYYRTTTGNDCIGRAKRCVIIGNKDYTLASANLINNTSCDAAISSLSSYTLIDTVSSPRILGFNANPPFQFATDYEIDSLLDISSPNYAAPIFKCGRTTGPIGYPGNTYSCKVSVYEFNTANVGTYSGYRSYFSNSFWARGNAIAGRGGDSGSAYFALLSANNYTLSAWKCIGLLFAGPADSSYSVGCRITSVIKDLDVVPWDGKIPTLSASKHLLTLPSTQIQPWGTSAVITLSGRKYYQLGVDNSSPVALTPTPTITITPSITPTITVTPTVTRTPTVTPTISITPTITPTITTTSGLSPTLTPTVTPTISLTPSLTPTQTLTPTISITPSVTPTITITFSVTPTRTPTPTITPTITITPSVTPTSYSVTTTAYDTLADYPYDDFFLYLTGGAGFFDTGFISLPTYGPFDNFANYNIGIVTSLSGGQNFYAPGVFFVRTAVNAYDTFEGYTIGDITILNQGTGFVSNGICFSAIKVNAYDTLSNYSIGSITSLNQGAGFFNNGIFVIGV